MLNLSRLFIGELRRLIKYRLLFIGLIFSFVWVVIVALTSLEEIKAFLPFLLVLDTGVMAIILLAASFYYEKQEATISSLLVAPVSIIEILVSKVAAALVSGVITLVLMSLAMLIFHGYIFNYLLALLWIILSTLAHIAIGYMIIFISRDFLGLLLKYSLLTLVLMLPALLIALQLITGDWVVLAFLSPTYAAQFLMSSLFSHQEFWQILLAGLYLLLLSGMLFPFVIYRQFKSYALRG